MSSQAPKHSGYRGRGAISKTRGRFAKRTVEPDTSGPLATDPGMGGPDADAGSQLVRSPETRVTAMRAKTIISSNQSPDVPFGRSINPYLGCEHGCVYCYARPGHSYLDLSPGLDFETQIFYKHNAAERLLDAWGKPGYQVQPITIGANTDPYQPAEKSLHITRRLLELFLEHRHPVSLISKGTLMERDLDLLSELAQHQLCSVAISIPTMNMELKRTLEPRVPSAAARLKLIRKLADVGVPVDLLMAPIIPAVNDLEIERIVAEAAGAGVTHAAYIFLRLPHEVGEIFAEWLETHMPDRASHVMSLVSQAGGGRHYDPRFGRRMKGQGPYADMIGQRFRKACKLHGIDRDRLETRQNIDCTQFRRPGPHQSSMNF